MPPLELQRHEPARFARKAIGNELLEVVANLDPYLTLLDREDDEQPIVAAALSYPAPPCSKSLLRIPECPHTGRSFDGGDNDHVTGRPLERATERVDGCRARGVDDLGKIVDWLGQLQHFLRLPLEPATRANTSTTDANPRGASESPCVDDSRQLLDRRQVVWKASLRGHRDRVPVLQAQYVDDDAFWKGGGACAFSRGGLAVERVRPLFNHPTLRSSAANAGAEVVTRSAIACGRPPVST